MNIRKIMSTLIVFLLVGTSTILILTTSSKSLIEPPSVEINIQPLSIIYEGDIIDCNITGNPTYKYWSIDNQSKHTTFYNDNPIIFDPEPTPNDIDYVNLTVYVENAAGISSDTIPLIIKRIYFGDIHWHTNISDGLYLVDEMYENAIKDNYLDFAACTDHANKIPLVQKKPFLKYLLNLILYGGPWQRIKDLNDEYYDEGNFTTLLGFEWSASNFYPSGYRWSKYGHEDVSHINFYYRDNYPDAKKFSPWQKPTYDDILEAMSEENDKGFLNIGYPHHPLGKLYSNFLGEKILIELIYNANWTFLANNIENTEDRDKIIRGVEVYSRWGTSIGQYSELPIPWPYLPDNKEYSVCISNRTESWVENAMWEWSENLKGRNFAMIASSDTHMVDRPGSAQLDKLKPSGIIAAYSVHNNRGEIWDAMNTCTVYATQLLKIRANVRVDDQLAIGNWINCTSPLNIQITAMSTFPGVDSNGKSMSPHGYNNSELNYPISDIWLMKKDRDKGQPWCKSIGHIQPNENLVVAHFEDDTVQPNDFYYVVIRQQGEELREGQLGYMAYIGPIFINNVE